MSNSFFKNQNFNKLKNECLQEGKLFSDEFFKLNVSDAVWIRPPEICENPSFVVDTVSRFDVKQGNMGNCWMVAAMANLTMNKVLFRHVVPREQSFKDNYVGMFRFRLWQVGEWVEVVVDDRLPTKDGNLIFVHSKSNNEFWSALLEKAYAKLYGGYGELVGGWFCEAMVDFTGGLVETVSILPPPPNLEKILLSSYKKGSFMCVFMKSDPSVTELETPEGLVKGHGYSLTKVQYVATSHFFGNFLSEEILLVRLRNPWGRIEWNGAWSDSSPEWNSVTEEQKVELGLVSDNDGEFWMSFSDLTNNFEKIDICNLSPSLFGGTNLFDGEVLNSAPERNSQGQLPFSTQITWKEHIFKGEWIKDVNAGGVSCDTIHLNPQFRITLQEPDNDDDNTCTLIVALMQKNKSRRVWHRIGITLFQIDESTPVPLNNSYITYNLSTASVSKFMFKREVVLRYEWPPGVYCILPSTKNPDHEGRFLLRVFSEKEFSMEELGEHSAEDTLETAPPDDTRGDSISVNQAPAVTSKYRGSSQGKQIQKLVHRSDEEVKAYFNRISGREKEMGWQELQKLLQFAMSPDLGLFTSIFDTKDVKFPKYECRNLIAMMDYDHSGKMGFDEFQSLWSRIRKWESIFLRCGGNSEYITAPVLKRALTVAGYRTSSSTIGNLKARHSDDSGRFNFNDFVMCAIELENS